MFVVCLRNCDTSGESTDNTSNSNNSPKYANEKQMIRAALTIDSDTRSGDNQRIIAGTPFHPIKIIEAKNTTFFKITIVKLTSSVPKSSLQMLIK